MEFAVVICLKLLSYGKYGSASYVVNWEERWVISDI